MNREIGMESIKGCRMTMEESRDFNTQDRRESEMGYD